MRNISLCEQIHLLMLAMSFDFLNNLVVLGLDALDFELCVVLHHDKIGLHALKIELVLQQTHLLGLIELKHAQRFFFVIVEHEDLVFLLFYFVLQLHIVLCCV